MTFHRALLVLSRGPLAGHKRQAVIDTKKVSSLALSPLQGMSRSMTTMVHWPSDGDSSLTPARAKLQHVLEEYRQNKYVHDTVFCTQFHTFSFSTITFASRIKRSSRFAGSHIIIIISPFLFLFRLHLLHTSSVSVRRSFLAFSRK